MIARTTLEETSELITDGTHGSPKRTGDANGIPLLSAKNVFDGEVRWDEFDRVPLSEWKEFQKRVSLKAGDVLMTCVGSIGRAAVWSNEKPVVFFRSVAIIRPKTSLNSKYLEYVIRSRDFQDELRRRTKRSSQGGVYLKDIRTMPIAVPPLAEQHRIVKLLDEATELRKLRAEADHRTAALIPALFHEMFGDPTFIGNRWTMVPLKSVGKVTTGNTPPRKNTEFFGDFIEWVKTSNIDAAHGIVTKTAEGLSEEGASWGRIVPAGTVVITCIAGSRKLIGDAAVTDRDVAINQQINAVTPNADTDSAFLCQQIGALKSVIQKRATGIMTGIINKSALESIPVIRPPLPLQKEFGERVSEIRALEAEQATSRHRLDDLFQSLLHRAFNGELSAETTGTVRK